MNPRFHLLLALLVAGSPVMAEPVRVVKSSQGWQLLIHNEPFWVKGVGCNEARGQKGEDYLRMARDMGANAVRTWGGADRAYLDQAEAYGLKVDLGIWLNPIRGNTTESYQDPEFCKQTKENALAYVREMKDHPALLTWNIGNETFSFIESAAEREAFGHFLEDLIRAVHQEDPDHPIVYASSSSRDLPDLIRYVPSLDIVGANIYGSLAPVLGWLQKNGVDRPVLVTEYGPVGSWDMNKDKNGVPYDPLDQLKSSDYASLWRQIEAAHAQCLGGFAFVLGEQRNQDSWTWFNINLGDEKRAAYWTLYQLYTGKSLVQEMPKITAMQLEPSEASPRAQITVTTQAMSRGDAPLTYTYYVTDIADDPLVIVPPRFYPVQPEVIRPGMARLRVPNDPGIYRIYVVVSNDQKDTAVADRSFRVSASAKN